MHIPSRCKRHALGIRRYQNPDGTLTEAGKKKYSTARIFEKRQATKAMHFKKAANTTRAIGIGLAYGALMSPYFRPTIEKGRDTITGLKIYGKLDAFTTILATTAVTESIKRVFDSFEIQSTQRVNKSRASRGATEKKPNHKGS